MALTSGSSSLADDGSDRVGVVVVSYNSSAKLRPCIEHLQDDPRVSVVVVDNCSADGSVNVAAAVGADVLALDRNTGFAYACNRGAALFKESCAWLAFVNPDVGVSGKGLVRIGHEAPDAVCAMTPLIVEPDGKSSRVVARPDPTLGQVAARLLLTGRAEWKARRVFQSFQRARGRYFEAPVLSGACLLVRTSAFREVGGFEETYFLSIEDVDICWRLRARRARLLVDRSLVATHAQSTSSANIAEEARLLETARGEIQFFLLRKSRAAAVCVGVAHLAGCGVRRLGHVMAGHGDWGVESPLAAYRRLAGVIVLALRGKTGTELGRPAEPMFL